MNSRTNKLAWKIRRNLADAYECKVIEIPWGYCYHRASVIINKQEKKAVRKTGSLITMNNVTSILFKATCLIVCFVVSYLFIECFKYNSVLGFIPVIGIVLAASLWVGSDLDYYISNKSNDDAVLQQSITNYQNAEV